MKNYGYIKDEIQPEDWILGSILSAPLEILQNDGQWLDFIPEGEKQNRQGVETFSCVSFGTLNCLEILLKRKFQELKNYSERFTAIVSNTGSTGNSPQAVAQSIRHFGIIEDYKLPFIDGMSYELFFSPKPMTEDYLKDGKEFLINYEVNHEYVFTDEEKNKQKKLMLALRSSPVGVAVTAWHLKDGLYYKPEGGQDNHFVCCVGYKLPEEMNNKKGFWLIYDSYASETDEATIQQNMKEFGVSREVASYLKKLEFDYDFSQAKRFHISKNLTPAQLSIYEQIISAISKIVSLLSQIAKKPLPVKPEIPMKPEAKPKYLWDTKENARHSVRIICDEEGLTLKQKNEITETINCESGFKTNAVNKNTNGTSDYGIIQANSYWYIGEGKPIPSIEVALNDPTFCVRIMARAFKNGRAKDWICYRRLYG